MRKKFYRGEHLPMQLQLFAEEDGAGAEGGNDGGAGSEGETRGKPGEPGGAGSKETAPSFDDLLKGGHQAEFDRRIQKAIDTALTNQKSKYEALMDDKLSEAEKLAKMSREEKAQYQQQKKERELADKEVAITRRELMAEAKNTLAEKKLPGGLAEVLNYTDADSCSKSMEAVEKAFQEAVQAAVEEKLKGGVAPKKAPSQEDTELAKKVESLMMGIV